MAEDTLEKLPINPLFFSLPLSVKNDNVGQKWADTLQTYEVIGLEDQSAPPSLRIKYSEYPEGDIEVEDIITDKTASAAWFKNGQQTHSFDISDNEIIVNDIPLKGLNAVSQLGIAVEEIERVLESAKRVMDLGEI